MNQLVLMVLLLAIGYTTKAQTGSNLPPVANDDYTTTAQSTTVVIDVLANDYDPDSNQLTSPKIFVTPIYGTVTINPNGTVTYTPLPNFLGCDSFYYVVCDTLSMYAPSPLCDTARIVVCTQPNNCNLTATVIADSTNGLVTAIATGGTMPFTYIWDDGSTASSTQNNPAQIQCVTVTDANGCMVTACEDTANSGGCTLQVAIGQNAIGGMSAAVLGNFTNPVSYFWSNGATGNSISVSVAGYYSVTATDANGCTGTNGLYYQGNCFDTICGTAFYDLNNNGVFDGNDQPNINAIIVANNTTAITDSSGQYEIVIPCNQTTVYLQAYDNDSTGMYFITFPLNNYYYFMDSNQTTPRRQCGYDFGFNNDFVEIKGTVYNDANSNGIKDASESGLPYQFVNVGTTNAYTDFSGNFSAIVPLGSYTVTYTASGWYSGYAVSPASGYTINGTTSGQVYANNNFGVVIPAGSVNLAVDIIPHTTVTPGFPAWYDIEVCNIGATPTAATLNMFYDAALNFNYASPMQASHNSSTNTITWNIPTLAPGQCMYYWANFNAPTTVALGYNAANLVNVLPISGTDVYMANNVDTTHQIAVGSWDPNNKLPEESNFAANPNKQYISSVNSNQWIDYVINFQNTGTAPAVNVVVKDIISSDLDISTLQFTASSHSCTATRTGNEMVYKFSSIMLPDSSSNEAASHGFVKFKIKAKDNLAVGHVISDDAAIYFDFNSPVITNDAAVTLIGTTGINDDATAATIAVQPNPVQTFTTIKLSDANTAGFTFTLYDMTGRKIATQQTSGTELRFERGNTEKGVYLYIAEQNGKAVAKGKLIMQ